MHSIVRIEVCNFLQYRGQLLCVLVLCFNGERFCCAVIVMKFHKNATIKIIFPPFSVSRSVVLFVSMENEGLSWFEPEGVTELSLLRRCCLFYCDIWILHVWGFEFWWSNDRSTTLNILKSNWQPLKLYQNEQN